MFKKLKKIADEMNAQDNRAIDLPLFVVQETKKGKDVFNLKAGFFLTGKACDEHIEQNSHYYNKNARSYAVSAWRNPEMETIMNYLQALGSIKK